jgi:hypothetical protein
MPTPGPYLHLVSTLFRRSLRLRQARRAQKNENQHQRKRKLARSHPIEVARLSYILQGWS